METEMKKEWKTPELIVLVRSNPEEAVLAACKWSFQNGPFDGCLKFGGVDPCDALAPS